MFILGVNEQEVNGAIDGAAENEGGIVVDNTVNVVTFKGVIGGNAPINLIQVGFGGPNNDGGVAVFSEDVTTNELSLFGGANNAAAASFAKNLDTDSIRLSASSTDSILTFNGVDAQTVSGTIDGFLAGEGTVVVSNTAAPVTFNGAIGSLAPIGNFTVVENASTVLNDVVSATNLNVSDGSRIILGDAFGDGTTVFTVGDVNTVADETTTVELPASFTDGTLTLADSGSNLASDVDQFGVTDNALATFAVGTANSDQDLTITATARSAAETASVLGVSLDTVGALTNAVPALDGDATRQAAFNAALNAGGATATQLAEQVATQADQLSGLTSGTTGAGIAAIGVTASRLAELRSPSAVAAAGGQTGFATGDGGLASAVWLKPFGSWTDQDDVDGVAGFDASTAGIAGGIDTEVTDGTRIGASLAWSTTDVDGEGAGQSQTDIDSLQLTLYGDYTTDVFYVEGMIGYGDNSNESTRVISATNDTVNGDFDSQQVMVSVNGGMPLALDGALTITPTAGLAYSTVSFDDYTETGAGGLSQRVSIEDVDAFIASIGAELSTRIEDGETTFIPAARLGASYDLAGDEAVASSQFTGGGATFQTTGAEVDELAGTVGLGLEIQNGAFSFGANYDAALKSNSVGHAASLEAKLKF